MVKKIYQSTFIENLNIIKKQAPSDLFYFYSLDFSGFIPDWHSSCKF